MELRCGARLHGIIADGMLETTCKSRWCGWEPGVVVVHRFNTDTGELVSTVVLKNPKQEEDKDAAHRSVSVRSA